MLNRRIKRERRKLVQVKTEYGDVILDESTGKYWHLNGTAALALEALQQGGDHDSAVARFVDTFGVSRETANADIAALTHQFRAAGLI